MPHGVQIETWIAAARAGDQFALTKLLATYHPLLRARASRQLAGALQVRLGPDDILQEAYVDVMRQIAKLRSDDPGTFASWLGGIVDHRIIDARRAAYSQKRDLAREAPALIANSDSYCNLLDQIMESTDTPSHVLRQNEAVLALSVCVTELPTAQGEVIELRFIQGLSVREAASRMGRSEAAVTALCQRALRELKCLMDRRGEFTRGG